MVKFSKLRSENLIHLTDRGCCVENVVNFFRRKIGEIMRYLPDNKFWLPLKRIAPKSATANPQHLAHNFPDFIQIGSLSAEL